MTGVVRSLGNTLSNGTIHDGVLTLDTTPTGLRKNEIAQCF